MVIRLVAECRNVQELEAWLGCSIADRAQAWKVGATVMADGKGIAITKTSYHFVMLDPKYIEPTEQERQRLGFPQSHLYMVINGIKNALKWNDDDKKLWKNGKLTLRLDPEIEIKYGYTVQSLIETEYRWPTLDRYITNSHKNLIEICKAEGYLPPKELDLVEKRREWLTKLTIGMHKRRWNYPHLLVPSREGSVNVYFPCDPGCFDGACESALIAAGVRHPDWAFTNQCPVGRSLS